MTLYDFIDSEVTIEMIKNKTQKKEKRSNYSISLTKSEQEELAKYASELGLSLSAFLRLATKEYIEKREKKEVEKRWDIY